MAEDVPTEEDPPAEPLMLGDLPYTRECTEFTNGCQTIEIHIPDIPAEVRMTRFDMVANTNLSMEFRYGPTKDRYRSRPDQMAKDAARDWGGTPLSAINGDFFMYEYDQEDNHAHPFGLTYERLHLHDPGCWGVGGYLGVARMKDGTYRIGGITSYINEKKGVTNIFCNGEKVISAIRVWNQPLKNGEIILPRELNCYPDDDAEANYPRTLVGLGTNLVVFLAVDGRQPGRSLSITSAQAAELLKREGCTDAGQFDGGGSTALWVNDDPENVPEGRYMNEPSGGIRAVANGLAVVMGASRPVTSTDVNFKVGEDFFETFGEALKKVAEGGAADIELLNPMRIQAPRTIDVSCTLRPRSGLDATDVMVSVDPDGSLTVGPGARVCLQDIVFTRPARTKLFVSATGTLAVTGMVDFAAVETEDAAGFELAGLVEPLTVSNGIKVTCASANGRGDSFATYSCSFEDAKRCGRMFVHATDDELACVAHDDGTFVWDRAMDPEKATLSVELPNGAGTNYYKRLNTLFRESAGDVTVTMLKDSSPVDFSEPIRVENRAITFRSETGATIRPAREMRFDVVAGGQLTFDGVTVADYTGECLFNVDGGELTLGAGTTLRNLSCSGGKMQYGVTVVKSGKMVMLPGAAIKYCHADHNQGCGGGVYVLNGVLDLRGGEITGCSAMTAGGGVYAYNGAAPYHAEVVLSGPVKIENNRSNLRESDNLCLALMNGALLSVTGDLSTAKIGINWQRLTLDASKDKPFATLVGVDPGAAGGFAFDGDEEKRWLIPTAEGTGLKWTLYENPPLPPPSFDTKALVVYEGEPAAQYGFKTVYEAFTNLTADATIVLTNYTGETDTDFLFNKEITIAHRVVLKGEDGVEGCTISRLTACPIRIVAGGELIVTNAVISGANVSGGEHPLIRVDGGRLELQAGATVRDAVGYDSRACGGVVVWNGGEFTMWPGSSITNCRNLFVTSKLADNGVGGGLLVENATAYLKGGSITGCSAAMPTAGAGICLANNAVAYVSGPLRVWGNSSTANRPNNIVIERSSRLCLDGAIPASDDAGADILIGIDPGVATDTNFVGYVTWEDASYDELRASAAQIRRSSDENVKAVVVTNGVDDVALLAWSDWLTHAGTYVSSDGTPHRLCLTSKQMLAVPMAFSVAPSVTADGQRVLKLEGGVEGCWYTVYSTTSLDKPFEVEATVQLEQGKTFEYPIVDGAASKFYKVVAEPGIRER